MVESGDIARIGPEAITVLVTARYILQNQDATVLPSFEELATTSGLTAEQVEQGIDRLYRTGYLDKQSTWEGGEHHERFTLREREIWFDQEGEISHEISWEPASPSGILGLTEFRNILAADRTSGAKIVHIERLQINMDGQKDSSFSEAVYQHERVNANPATEPAPVETSAPSSEPEPRRSDPEPSARTERGYTPEPEPKPKPEAGSPSEWIDDVAEFEKLYHHYVDRVHAEFATAFKAAEQAADQAYRALVMHEAQKPQRPVGLGALLNSRRYIERMDRYREQHAELQKSFELSTTERQRLLEAMMPSESNQQPLYVREALEQLQEEHPQLWARTERARKSWA